MNFVFSAGFLLFMVWLGIQPKSSGRAHWTSKSATSWLVFWAAIGFFGTLLEALMQMWPSAGYSSPLWCPFLSILEPISGGPTNEVLRTLLIAGVANAAFFAALAALVWAFYNGLSAKPKAQLITERDARPSDKLL